MPTLRPASPRQISFLNSLVAERSAESLAPLEAEIERAVSGGGIARDLIDRVMALPHARRPLVGGNGRADQVAAAASGEQVEAPSAASRAGRMLRAGGIEATVTFDDGRHCTVTVRTRGRRGRGYANMAPGEEGARTNISVLGSRVGWANVVDGRWTLTLRTRRDDYRRAILSVFEYAATGSAADGSRVQEASRCGRCFRTLTDPVSIDRGIGPECFGRDTGSQHVAAERAASGDAVVRTVTGEPGAPLLRTVTGEPGAPTEAEADAFIRNLDAQGAPLEGPRRPAPSLTDLAARVAAPANANVTRARELIAEALDAYCTDADRDFAMRTFDNLAAR